MCLSGLKKTELLKLDLTLFQIYDASKSQFNFDSIPTPTLTLTTHISLCPHLKKITTSLAISQKVNRTSTCRTHCRMTSIMFKFRQTYSRLNEQANCKCML